MSVWTIYLSKSLWNMQKISIINKNLLLLSKTDLQITFCYF